MQLWFEQALLPDGWRADVRVTVEQGRIAQVRSGVAPAPADERHGPAIPGLANVHSHAFQRGMAGLAERAAGEEAAGGGADGFWTWRDAMYRFVDRLDPEGLNAIAALAYIEMLESGFTRVGEFHYLHHDRDGRPYADRAAMSHAIAEAARISGIALTLLPVFYAHSGFGGIAPADGQRRFIHDLDGYAILMEGAGKALAGLEGAVLGVAPHSLRAVTSEELLQVAALRPHDPVHIHIAEQMAEVEACLEWSGQSPVEWLFDHAPVGSRWCLIHATHVTGEELDRIARSQAVVGLCPITEANLGDGLFPARAFLDKGGRMAIGSDSNVEIDAPGELRLLEYGQRLYHRSRNLLASGPGQSTGASLWRASRQGGAQALGAEAPAIAPGVPADIVAFRADDVAFTGRLGDAILDSWIFAGGKAMVDTVWRHGVKRVSEGRHVARPAIEARYRRTLGACRD
ncbi:formiminoglutamate deiminase [Sphingobium faniae]|nr:formiminoglutamate deiminase [Sphingobium faniae]